LTSRCIRAGSSTWCSAAGCASSDGRRELSGSLALLKAAQVGKFNLPFCDDPTWDEIAAFRRLWDGLHRQGIMHPEDADAQSRPVRTASSFQPWRPKPRCGDASARVLPRSPTASAPATVLLDSGTRGSDIAKIAPVPTGFWPRRLCRRRSGRRGRCPARDRILTGELTRVMTNAGRGSSPTSSRELRMPWDFARLGGSVRRRAA
jgi:hypothetical protein